MERIDGSIINQEDGFSTQNMMFTYSEEEQLENKIAKNNAKLPLRPKFIPVYPGLLWNGYSVMEALLFGFIEFFLNNNEKFYCTNEQLAELFNCNEKTISNAMKNLEARGDIKIHKKPKAGGGLIRFITLETGKKVIFENVKKGFSKSTNLPGIYNNIINNNNKSKDLLLLKEEEIKAKKEEDLLEWLADNDQKEIKSYGKPEINELIGAIKEECDRLGVAYVKKKERNFSQLILTSKDYGELCDKLGMSRKEFAVNILRASVAINYFKGACSGPMRIYENYAEVYNLTKQKSDKNKLVEQNFTSLY